MQPTIKAPTHRRRAPRAPRAGAPDLDLYLASIQRHDTTAASTMRLIALGLELAERLGAE